MASRIVPGALLLCCLAANLAAQEYSYDGNRWYEVEVAIFANPVDNAPDAEITLPERTNPAYFPRLRQLLPRWSSYQVDFNAPPFAAVELPAPQEPAAEEFLQSGTVSSQTIFAPLYSPALRESFRLLDPGRDAFMDLDARSGEFQPMLRNLESSGQYRLLWHRFWRQPMQGRAQVEAVFVEGGDRFGDHSELEGSLRFSDSGGRAYLDLAVWHGSFELLQAGQQPADPWSLPDNPFVTEEEATAADDGVTESLAPFVANWQPRNLWLLREGRELGANQLYYLDHPRIGVIVQVRPYVLPPRVLESTEEDF